MYMGALSSVDKNACRLLRTYESPGKRRGIEEPFLYILSATSTYIITTYHTPGSKQPQPSSSSPPPCSLPLPPHRHLAHSQCNLHSIPIPAPNPVLPPHHRSTSRLITFHLLGTRERRHGRHVDDFILGENHH